MTVGLVPLMTDEQAMLVDASTRFMAAEVPLSVVRARADGAPRDDTAYLRTAAELAGRDPDGFRREHLEGCHRHEPVVYLYRSNHRHCYHDVNH